MRNTDGYETPRRKGEGAVSIGGRYTLPRKDARPHIIAEEPEYDPARRPYVTRLYISSGTGFAAVRAF